MDMKLYQIIKVDFRIRIPESDFEWVALILMYDKGYKTIYEFNNYGLKYTYIVGFTNLNPKAIKSKTDVGWHYPKMNYTNCIIK